ncbi:hypothetical protein [Alteribacter keqinensis]|uniref:Uncharacterized protein n=1 Tax=Alteribacter keqinensis TaxID=2483800 RepID=A0A3M7TWL3_9BACI|nr:hypothetical protein [Alteribacter keqinensis]RNA70040.1 hypothetical protein EBO34_08950 [Alteribacter keqinensis]
MAQEEQERPGRNFFDDLMFGARPEEEEQPENEEVSEETEMSEAQMEQTMAQIAAIMDTAEKLKPYAKHLAPIWDAIKKVAITKPKDD